MTFPESNEGHPERAIDFAVNCSSELQDPQPASDLDVRPRDSALELSTSPCGVGTSPTAAWTAASGRPGPLRGGSGRVRRRAVVLRGFVYFVGTHTRSTVPLGRSAAVLGAIIEGPQILFLSERNRVGKGLSPTFFQFPEARRHDISPSTGRPVCLSLGYEYETRKNHLDPRASAAWIPRRRLRPADRRLATGPGGPRTEARNGLFLGNL